MVIKKAGGSTRKTVAIPSRNALGVKNASVAKQ